MSSTVLTLPSWKQEPLSPPNCEDAAWASYPEDDLFYSSLEQNVDLKLERDLFSPCIDSKADVAAQLLEDLEKLADLDELIKEEPFFLDMKMLPVLDEIDQSRYPVKIEHFKAPNTDQLIINDFDSVPMCTMLEFGPVPTTLTPPQSPPGETTMLTTLKPLVATTPMFQIFQNGQAPTEETVPEKLIDNVLIYREVDYPVLVTPQPDIAHELAVVDELVRSRVENMQWASSGPSSPCSNSSSDSSFDDSCSSSDPEWVPETVDNLNESLDNAKTPSRKRSKPYSRSVDDKKSRKKEQNKNAATRYRMKKKAEVEVIIGEEKQLMQVGEKFSNQITDIQREIKYLKSLMRDLFKAKGLIS